MEFLKNKKCIIIGSSGAIGSEFVNQMDSSGANQIYSFSRTETSFFSETIINNDIDITDEASIQNAALSVAEKGPFDVIILATGILYDDDVKPEKALRQLNKHNFEKIYLVNTIGPALIMKHFSPLLNKNDTSLFAVLSARVGSVEDNQMGGWYAYRASKAALNMVMRNTAIEIGRFNKNSIFVSLHPGTVDSHLSEPFKKNVKPEKLFTAEFAVSNLLNVLSSLTPKDTGNFFAWDGQKIPF